MRKSLVFSLAFCLLILAFSCKEESNTLFKLRSSAETGIQFTNKITSSDSFNILTYEYIYNGVGVAAADFNNDGLQDLFFTGNQVQNRLYINQGDFNFRDVTNFANVNVNGRWSSGVSVVDINSDGLMDLYVCATTYPDSSRRKNMLFVNQGIDGAGNPTFIESASQYKIDFDGYSMMSAFFDYDKDGDLDLYILVNVRESNTPSTNYREKLNDGTAKNRDKLFRNEGDGTFKDVSLEAGIVEEGFGLGLAISDFNKDGWPDIYVSNDYLTNDILYLNNKNGTFKNSTHELLGHQSQFSMGNDAADINNDALPDIITLDMLPETNERKKRTIANKSYQTYINNERFGYEPQYVRNMLHLNNGAIGEINFSEVGELAGIYQTEWSWSPLFADFDNDGFKDLLITNGFPKDITDKDFANFRATVEKVATNQYLVDSIPVIKIPNYAFKNINGLNFKDVTADWGVGIPSFSNGAAYCDLDNDGDLDYVVNNIDDEAFVFENTLYNKSKKESSNANYLRIQINSSGLKDMALGSTVTLYLADSIMWSEKSIYRGYLSTIESQLHFGLGSISLVDSVVVQWPDGNVETRVKVKPNTTLTFNYRDSHAVEARPSNKTEMFTPLNGSVIGLNYKHQEDDKIDFNLQRTIPHKFSQSGPGIAIGDLNNDGLEDIFIGGSAGSPATILMQGKKGFSTVSFNKSDLNREENAGALLFDADSDSDLDLYLVSGSIEEKVGDPSYQDRLYLNDGKGRFTFEGDRLPLLNSSGSCVRAVDFDSDGDLDLFVGGRVIPGSYPLSPESYLLRNESGKFINVTGELAPDLSKVGMVTDALWTDFDNDGKIDLMVALEFSPIKIFKNNGRSFEVLKNSNLDKYSGWWNSISAADFDSDGDIDYVVGNLGQNNNYNVTLDNPLTIFAKDFDNNGSVDPILACYAKLNFKSTTRELCPIHFWDELNSQSPKFRQQFSYYKQYANVTMNQLLSENDLKGATILKANYMSSSLIRNLGNGSFEIKALPIEAQVAPINGMLCDDFNEDGFIDILMIGNDFGNEVFAGKYDAFTGLLLSGDGKGNFKSLGSKFTGFKVDGDAKALAMVRNSNMDLILATQNRDSLRVFRNTKPVDQFLFQPGTLDSYAIITYPDKKQRVEFYYGSSYWSQSSRKIRISSKATSMVVFDTKGQSRNVDPKKMNN